jgi:hypothetical protein
MAGLKFYLNIYVQYIPVKFNHHFDTGDFFLNFDVFLLNHNKELLTRRLLLKHFIRIKNKKSSERHGVHERDQ